MPEAGFSIVAGVPRVTLKGGPPSAPVTLAVRVVHEGGRRLALQWLLSDGSLSQKLLLVVGTP
jgi:hypothetical protein